MTAGRPGRAPAALIVAVVAVVTVVTVAGCGRLGRPDPGPWATVDGRVRIGPTPIRGGWVEFFPTGGGRGALRSAPIGPDGRFHQTRIARGGVVIRLVRPEVDPAYRRLVGLFERLETSPIRRSFPGGPAPVDLDLDLLVEARRPAPGRGGPG